MPVISNSIRMIGLLLTLESRMSPWPWARTILSVFVAFFLFFFRLQLTKSQL